MSPTYLARKPLRLWSAEDIKTASNGDIVSHPLGEFATAPQALRQRIFDAVYPPPTEPETPVEPPRTAADWERLRQRLRNEMVGEVLASEDIPRSYRLRLAADLERIWDDTND